MVYDITRNKTQIKHPELAVTKQFIYVQQATMSTQQYD